MYMSRSACTNICVTVDVSQQAILLLFNSCCAGTNTAHEVSVDLPIVQQQSEIEDHQGSHADHKVRMLLHPLLLTTNLSVVGSPFPYSRSTMLLLVMVMVLVLVRCRATISRVQSKA